MKDIIGETTMTESTSRVKDLFANIDVNKKINQTSSFSFKTADKNNFRTQLGYLEGKVEHTDTVGIQTTPYGIARSKHASKIDKYAKQLGVSADALSVDNYADLAQSIFSDFSDEISKSTPEYKTLTPEQKFAVTSAKYNTGVTFKNGIKSIVKYNNNPSFVNLSNVVKEFRRFETHNKVKTRTKGMDNRAVKELVIAGIIDLNNSEHIKALDTNLPLWSKKDL